MRLFKDFKEGMNEIQRDLKEMGTKHITKTMQDKDVKGDHNFDTLELTNYGYTILNPQLNDISGVNRSWCRYEWDERKAGITGHAINPGTAWQERPDIWKEFIHEGKFSYTYPERFSLNLQVMNIIRRLKVDKGSRQLFISVWDSDDATKLGEERVPCTLGYVLQHRNDRLNITSLMRSCDLFTHYPNDCFLTLTLLNYIAFEAGLQVGTFSHFINSFHVYEKDVSSVF
jgi:thymidylate synthase